MTRLDSKLKALLNVVPNEWTHSADIAKLTSLYTSSSALTVPLSMLRDLGLIESMATRGNKVVLWRKVQVEN